MAVIPKECGFLSEVLTKMCKLTVEMVAYGCEYTKNH